MFTRLSPLQYTDATAQTAQGPSNFKKEELEDGQNKAMGAKKGMMGNSPHRQEAEGEVDGEGKWIRSLKWKSES